MTLYDSLLQPVRSIEGSDLGLIQALENLKGAVDGLTRALHSPPRSAEAKPPPARGAELGRIHALSHTLARLTRTLARTTETGSSGDMGWEAGTCGDLPRLTRTRARLRALRGACDTLAHYPLSIAGAETQLAAVLTHLDRVLLALQRAIDLATRQQDSRILWTQTGS